MTSKLKVAVTGLKVSEGYLKNWKNAPETELVLVHDIDEVWAKHISEKYSVPRWTASFEEVLKAGIDILDVSTPNHCHAEQSIAAMRAGIHVLCQKPMAINLEECQQMIEVSRETERMCSVFMTKIDEAIHVDFKKAVQEGCLGKIASIRVRNAHRAPYLGKTGAQGWRGDPKRIGGGGFLQLGIHVLNLILWIMEEEVNSVMAYSNNLYCKHSLKTDDVFHAIAELEKGTLFSLESGYSSVGSSVEIYGTEGRILWTENHLRVQFCKDFEGISFAYQVPDEVFDNRPELSTIDLNNQRTQAEKWESEFNQHRLFAQSILGERELVMPCEHGYRDMAIIKAMEGSASTGKRIDMKDYSLS